MPPDDAWTIAISVIAPLLTIQKPPTGAGVLEGLLEGWGCGVAVRIP